MKGKISGLLATGLLLASPAQAAIILDWTGACSVGCTGNANGVLTLSDSFVSGGDFFSFTGDVLSFSYSSSSASFAASPADPAFFAFGTGLNADGSLTSLFFFYVTNGADVFQIDTKSWIALTGPPTSIANLGEMFAFTPRANSVPEPDSLGLLGLAGLGLSRRRRA